jgi:hypothetical protein
LRTAENMPPSKYSFRPNPSTKSFAQVMIAVVDLNRDLCSIAGGVTPPKAERPTETDSKEKMILALRSSFAFCETAFLSLNDKKMGDTVQLSREMDGPRAAALFALAEGWAELDAAANEALNH